MVNSFYPPWVGGAERYVSSIARVMARRGHHVTVYCSERPLKAGESFEGGVRVVRLDTPLMLYGTPLVVLPPSIVGEDYDVIHANFPGPYLASATAITTAIKSIPGVLTWHNDLPPVTSGAGLLVKLHDALAPAYLNLFDRIVATTAAYTRTSRLLRRFSGRVVVIPNGVDSRRFSPAVKGDAVRGAHGLEGRKVVLFVGAMTTWHAYKGFDVLLRAFARARRKEDSLRLLVVGSGNTLSAHRKSAIELGLADSVVFAGFVPDELLPEYYAASDLLVLPSLDSSEGFGLVLLEAMAAGRAVIGTRVGGVTDVVREGENGLLAEPGDVEGLSEKMLELAGSDDERARMGEAGRRFAKSNDWSRIAERVERLYGEIH